MAGSGVNDYSTRLRQDSVLELDASYPEPKIHHIPTVFCHKQIVNSEVSAVTTGVVECSG